jgi:hypothetical protein
MCSLTAVSTVALVLMNISGTDTGTPSMKTKNFWIPIVGFIALGAHGAAAQSTFEIARDVEAVRIESSGQNITPRQSVTPGGVPRHTSDYELTVTWEPGARRAREEWELHNLYPADAIYPFTMTYHEQFGRTEGKKRAGHPPQRPDPWARHASGPTLRNCG